MGKFRINTAFRSFVLFGSFLIVFPQAAKFISENSDNNTDPFKACEELPNRFLFDKNSTCVFYIVKDATWLDARNDICRIVINSERTQLYRIPKNENAKSEHLKELRTIPKTGNTFWTGDNNCSEYYGCKFLWYTADWNIEIGNHAEHHSALCQISKHDLSTSTTSEIPIPTDKTEAKTTATTQQIPVPVPTTPGRTLPAESTISKKTTIMTTSTTAKPIFCKETPRDGVKWATAKAGEWLTMPCPAGSTGSMKWYCSDRGEFIPTTGPQSNCVQTWLENLYEQSNKTTDPVEIVDDLANKTESNELLHGRDVTTVLNIIINTWNRLKKMQAVNDSKTTHNYTQGVVASVSNTLNEKNEVSWKKLNETEKIETASRFLQTIETIGTTFSWNNRLTNDTSQIEDQHIGLQSHILGYDGKDLIFPEPHFKSLDRNSVMHLPRNISCGRQSTEYGRVTGVGTIYENIGKHLGQYKQDYELNSVLIGFTIGNSTEKCVLSDGHYVTITFKHLNTNNVTKKNLACVFWNFNESDYGSWSPDGCETHSFNETHITCQCDHLTNFAVFMSAWQPPKESEALTIITMTCCILSMLSLAITMLCLQGFRTLRCRRSTITCNLAVCLLVVNLLTLVGLDKSEDKIMCLIIKGMLHYWLLAAFIWMLFEGIILYQMVIVVFNKTHPIRLLWFYLMGYGLPLIIASITAAVRREGNINGRYCWLSAEKGEIWSFLAPMGFIVLVNLIFVIMALHAAANIQGKKIKSTVRKVTKLVRGSFFLFCLLGITWTVGFFHFDGTADFIPYIFAVLNSLQGFFIFLYHVVLNRKTRTTVIKFFKGKSQQNKSRTRIVGPHHELIRRQMTHTSSLDTAYSLKNTATKGDSLRDRNPTKLSIISFTQ